MYTQRMYIEDRTEILSRIRDLRSDMNNPNSYDWILPDWDNAVKEYRRKIKFYQELLVIIRGRYYGN